MNSPIFSWVNRPNHWHVGAACVILIFLGSEELLSTRKHSALSQNLGKPGFFVPGIRIMPLDLTGKRVKLRALEARDLDPICEAYKDLDLELITGGDTPPVSDVQVRAFWEEIIADPGPELRYFAIEALPDSPDSGKLVGACSL